MHYPFLFLHRLPRNSASRGSALAPASNRTPVLQTQSAMPNATPMVARSGRERGSALSRLGDEGFDIFIPPKSSPIKNLAVRTAEFNWIGLSKKGGRYSWI